MVADRSQSARHPTWKLAIYILGTVVVSVFALAINMGMVYLLFTSTHQLFPELVAIHGGQLFLYIGPFMLLFLEWWLWDIIADQFRRNPK